MVGHDLKGADIVADILSGKLGSRALVYSGWPNDRMVKELRRSRGLPRSLHIPEISITEYESWPRHLDINVWAKTPHERDDISNSVMRILRETENSGRILIAQVETQDIAFEEKGSLRPGKWDIVEGSKPVFRKLIQVTLTTSG